MSSTCREVCVSSLWASCLFYQGSHIAFQVAQMVNNLPAMQETGFDPWAGKIPWRREWLPISVFCLENPHGQRSLVGYSPWGCKESGMTDWLSTRPCTWNCRRSSGQGRAPKSTGPQVRYTVFRLMWFTLNTPKTVLLTTNLTQEHDWLKPRFWCAKRLRHVKEGPAF